jgi:hypothetical protein
MLAHAGNRVCILKMQKPDVDTWLKWATDNAINPLIRAWVYMFPRSLASYTEGDQADNPYIFQPSKANLSFCSPRSLAKASVIVDNKEVLGDNAVMCALAGTIGASASADMSAFLSVEKSLPRFKDIIEKPSDVTMPTETSALLMLMFQATDNLASQEDLSAFMKFVNRIESSEIQAVFFTMMVRSKNGVKLARNNAEIAKWATENHELF